MSEAKRSASISIKQRLVGALVLVSLAVIFIPMILDGEGVFETNITETFIPAEPKFDFGQATVATDTASKDSLATGSLPSDKATIQPAPQKPVVGKRVTIVDAISEEALQHKAPGTQAANKSAKKASIDKNKAADTSGDVMPAPVKSTSDASVAKKAATEKQLATVSRTIGNKPGNAKATVEALKESKTRAVKAWAVQLGSFKTKPNALRLRDKLRVKGFPSYVEAVTTSGGEIYRVRVGPELQRSKAETLKKKLAKITKLDGMIVSH